MEKYSNLTVIRKYKKFASGKYSRMYCDCRCDCGNERTMRYDSVVNGKTKMCVTCAKKVKRENTITHGFCGTRQYRIWLDMKQRCYNPNQPAYMYYGGKGVVMCDDWRDSFVIFNKWLENEGYNDLLTVDRIESDEGYNPENCRLISFRENIIRAHLGKKHNKRKQNVK